jgi:hypothetical protein
MWPQSTRLATSLTAGGTVAERLDILVDGAVALSLDSTDPDFVDLGGPVTGRVEVQRGTVRRSCDVSLLDLDRTTLTQADALDLLVPLRAEIRPWRGMVFSDVTDEVAPNDRELVPLGTLVVADVDLSRWPLVQISGYDRTWLLALHRNITAFQPTANSPSMTALQDLLEFSTFPRSRLDTRFPTTNTAVGSNVWDAQSDLAEAAADIASAAGMVFYADPLGTFTCTPEADIDNDPLVLSYVEGTGLLVDVARKRSGSDVHNAVSVTSSAPDLATVVSGYAQDDDPTSATYVGALGVIPLFFDTPLVRTAAQADLAARTRLRNEVGIVDAITIRGPIQPGLELGDVLYVRSTSRGVDTRVIVDSFDISIAGDQTQTIVCRAQVATT